MAAYTQILETQQDGVLTLTLNRPERLNAWTPVMQAELEAAIRAAGDKADVRCIVITGAGRGFCAGADMNHLQDIQGDTDAGTKSATAGVERPTPAGLEKIYDGRFGYLYACPKPIIAAINGPCAGIGLIFALFTDLRFTTMMQSSRPPLPSAVLLPNTALAGCCPGLSARRMPWTSCSRPVCSRATKLQTWASSTSHCLPLS